MSARWPQPRQAGVGRRRGRSRSGRPDSGAVLGSWAITLAARTVVASWNGPHGQRVLGRQLRLQSAVRDRRGRHPCLSRQLRRHLGDGAEPAGDRRRRHPGVGGQLCRRLGDGAERERRPPGGDPVGGSYGFDDPEVIAADGTHVWVANQAGDSVTELAGG